MLYTAKKSSSGFTLVELSMVLLIIGLIVGAILVGQELIAISKIRNQISTIHQLETSLRTFSTKYNTSFLPGDYNKAEEFIGGASVNGNGSGDFHASLNPGDDDINEIFQFWIQLSEAGLVGGTFDGQPGVTSENALPRNIFSQSYTMLADTSLLDVDTSVDINGDSVNFNTRGTFYLFIDYPIPSSVQQYALPYINYWIGSFTRFPVESIALLDRKLDDGKPLTGRVITSCSYGSQDEYDYSDSSADCLAIISALR